LIHDVNSRIIAFQSSMVEVKGTVPWFADQAKQFVWGRNIDLSALLDFIREDLDITRSVENITNQLLNDMLITTTLEKVQVLGWDILDYLEDSIKLATRILSDTKIIKITNGKILGLNELVSPRNFDNYYYEIDYATVHSKDIYIKLLDRGIIVRDYDLKRLKLVFIIRRKVFDLLLEIRNWPVVLS
jgi:hypothetical protein